jgi:predicted ATPase
MARPARQRERLLGGRDLVGRLDELAALGALCAAGAPLITLWGPGGAGKTHLLRHFGALQAATRAAAGGVLACDLTEARTALDVGRCLGETLRLERPGPDASADDRALAAAFAGRRPTLFLLDNVEQARPAAGLLEGLLAAAPQHRFVATSREPLGLRAERCVEIGPLPAPDAARLFVLAARAIRPQTVAGEGAPALVRRIVARVDHLPLAIELAASRLEVLSLEELLERLDHQLEVLRGRRGRRGRRDGRHDTLEAAVRWSWDLLGPDERRVLASCAGFCGGFTPAAAEALAATGPRAGAVLAALEALRQRSLLQPPQPAPSGTRLRLYEAVREFALERLDESGGRAAVERRHAEVMLAWAEARHHRRPPTDSSAELDALALESDNLLAVRARFRRAAPELAARAVLALHPLFLLRGPFAAHAELIDELLGGAAPPLPARLEARLRLARAEVLRARGRAAEARVELDGVLRLARRSRDGVTTTAAWRLKGAVLRTLGRPADALRLLRVALRHARASGDAANVALTRGEMGAALAILGRLQEACRYHRAALERHRRAGDQQLAAVQLSHLGVATHRLGRAEDARRMHEAALATHRDLGNRRGEAADLSHLGFIAHQLGDHAASRASYVAARDRCREVGDRRLEAIVATFLGDLETDAGAGARGRALLHEAMGIFEDSGERGQQAVAWLHLAFNHEAAAELDAALAALTSAVACASPDQVWVQAAALACRAALLRRRGDARGAARAAARAVRWIRRLENPCQATAVRLLVAPTLTPRARSDAQAHVRGSSEVRRALRWVERHGGRELWIGPRAAWFSLGDVRVDLTRRGPMRRILEALIAARERQPGAGLPWHAIEAAGWPGEKVQTEAGLQRVYTAVWALRRMGLGDVLVSRADGYLLDPAVALRSFPA